MSNNKAIDIILRVRPHKHVFKGFTINQQQNKVSFFIPKDSEDGYINNKQQKRAFQFNQLFDMDAKQEKVFDRVAKDVIDSALSGYNGTIFAYGQTGSGKTFTMTGGSGSYDDRGLIPRTLSYIFNQSKVRSEKINVTISYLQIYQSSGYDLLVAENKSGKLDGLPKIQPREGPNQELYLTNLSAVKCDSQQDALNCLFLGDLNRVVSKTPKNDESTRSHCIFTINLQISKADSDIKTQSKIHLVDLSGSQRIKTTGVEGKLEKQAISINLGLHYLQRVITQLNKKMRGQNVHVPYRESLMTLILKNSLGGNCKTKMIATMSPKQEDVLQSISTLKFAMRVALIKNDLTRNQVVDPGVIIARLKQENAQLKAQIALLKGQESKDELDKYQIEDCHKSVEKYIQSQDPAAALILSDRLRINQCFYYLKTLLKKGGGGRFEDRKISENQSNENKAMMKSLVQPGEDDGRSSEEIRRLKLLLQQRDNEIALLLNLIKKKTGDRNEVVIPVKRSNEQENLLKSVVNQKPLYFPSQDNGKQNQSMSSKTKQSSANYQLQQKSLTQMDVQQVQRMLIKPVNLSSQQMLDQARAYEQFRKSYRKHEAMQKNLVILQEKMSRGKQVGKSVNELRQRISEGKQKLEGIKRQNVVNSLAQGKERIDPMQQKLQQQILDLKSKYKVSLDELRILKNDIESIKMLQQKNKQQLLKDFKKWYMIKNQQRKNMTSSINSSLLTSNIKDKQVMNHLQSFMAARQQIRRR